MIILFDIYLLMLSDLNLDSDIKLISTQELIENQQKYIIYTFEVRQIPIIVKLYDYDYQCLEFAKIRTDCHNHQMQLPSCRFYTLDQVEVGLITMNFNCDEDIGYYLADYCRPIEAICDWTAEHEDEDENYQYIHMNVGYSISSSIDYPQLYQNSIDI